MSTVGNYGQKRVKLELSTRSKATEWGKTAILSHFQKVDMV